MAWQSVGYKGLLHQVTMCGGAVTARSFAATTHWIGCGFVPSVTGTITTIGWSTGTSSSFSGGITAAIVNLDSTGLPDASSVISAATERTTGGATLAASTVYADTVSASVTAGTEYGILVKCSSFTSGSINVNATQAISAGLYSTNSGWRRPYASYNVGSTTRTASNSVFDLLYSGGVRYPVTNIIGCAGSSFSANNQTTAATTGQVVGNKFTTLYPVKVVGYAYSLTNNTTCDVGMFSGSDNTFMTGSSVSHSSSQTFPAAGAHVIMLPTPLELPAGTYRVGLKVLANTTIGLGAVSGLVDANNSASSAPLINIGDLATPTQMSKYTSSWADTAGAITAITPIISHIDVGSSASYVLGI